jgi:hypothetical protein
MRELPSILVVFHDSPEIGGHAGRDSMLYAIGNHVFCLLYLYFDF